MIAIALESAVRSSALIAAIGFGLTVVRARNAHLQKLLWSAAVIASLAMPMLLALPVAPIVRAPTVELTALAGGGVPSMLGGLRFAADGSYLSVLVLLLARYVIGWGSMRRICRSARPQPALDAFGAKVRVSARIGRPATFGSTILLPAASTLWSERKLRAVLAHERAHVAHRDCWMLWLARINAACFWFNPLAWWLARRLAALAEQTSDEAGVAALGSATDYAEILLELQSSRGCELVAAMAQASLSSRIERVLCSVVPSAAPTIAQRSLALTLLVPALAATAAPVQIAGLAAVAAPTSQAAAVTGEAAQPRIVGWDSLPSFYPKRARRHGIEGNVTIAVTLDPFGRPSHARIVREEPAGHGFGDAASAFALVASYTNPTGHPVTLVFNVRFALVNERPRSPPSAPKAPAPSEG